MHVLIVHIKAFVFPAMDNCMVESFGGGCNNQTRFARHNAFVYISWDLALWIRRGPAQPPCDTPEHCLVGGLCWSSVTWDEIAMWKLYALGFTIEWARDELDPWLKGSYDGRVVAYERIFKCKNTLRAIPKKPVPHRGGDVCHGTPQGAILNAEGRGRFPSKSNHLGASALALFTNCE
jgi:hypothetical protein